jgi:thiosulfate reductase cytochrome b subunit
MTVRAELAHYSDRGVARYVVRAGLASLVVVVLLARLLWDTRSTEAFIARYPGVATGAVSEGTGMWVVSLHALNLFFLVQIVASGLTVRAARRPIGHWTPRFGSGTRAPITIEQWFHVALDLLWLASGAVFVALLLVSGRWVRLVPTSWDVFPNALSVALQYTSLHWPEENSWLAYNALQMLAYFAVVFIVAPLAAITGLRLSPLWPSRARLNRWFPIELARKVHFAVMIAFVVFVVMHVAMVLAAGPITMLNHMFAGRNDDSLVGVLVLCGVLALSAGAVAAARPIVLRTLAGLTGRVTR